MRHRREIGFGLGSVERPLAEEQAFTVKDRNAVVASWRLSVGDVDVAGFGIHIDGGHEEELGPIGV